MEKPIFIISGAPVPAAETLPTLLQKPVSLLKKLPCVAGVISGHQQDDHSALLHISFRAISVTEYMSALGCFNVDGLRANYLYVNMADRFMIIKLKQTKTLLN